MTNIYKYKIINIIPDINRPYINDKDELIVPRTNGYYKWFVEAINYNRNNAIDKYYILLSYNKFNNSCRGCKIDRKNNLIIPVLGEIRDYIKRECKEHGNVDVNYIESTDEYDVFEVI